MNERFLASIAPETFTILGKRLQKFSLSHKFYLQRLGCEPVDTFSKLITAVLVCASPVGKIQETLDDPWLRLKLWWWGKRLGKFDVFAKIKLFNDYIEHHSQGPELFDEVDNGVIAGAPFEQHVRTTLLSRGWPVDYVATETWGLMLWDFYGYWENEGRASIMCDEIVDLKAWADSQHETILKEAAELARQEAVKGAG